MPMDHAEKAVVICDSKGRWPACVYQAGHFLSVLNSICAIFSPVLVPVCYYDAIRRRQIC